MTGPVCSVGPESSTHSPVWSAGCGSGASWSARSSSARPCRASICPAMKAKVPKTGPKTVSSSQPFRAIAIPTNQNHAPATHRKARLAARGGGSPAADAGAAVRSPRAGSCGARGAAPGRRPSHRRPPRPCWATSTPPWPQPLQGGDDVGGDHQTSDHDRAGHGPPQPPVLPPAPQPHLTSPQPIVGSA